MKIWTRAQKSQMRGVWMATKQKELRFASKLIQESIAAATIPSRVTTSGTFYINASGGNVENVGDTFPIQWLVNIKGSSFASGSSLQSGYISIFGANSTNGFISSNFDNVIGFGSESQLLQNFSSSSPSNISRINITPPMTILRWIESKPAILSANGNVKEGFLVLEQNSRDRGTYRLYLCKTQASTFTGTSGFSTPPASYSASMSLSQKTLLVSGVVRVEISAYILPNEPKLSDCSPTSGTQYLAISSSGVSVTTDSGGTTTNIISDGTNGTTTDNASNDARRKFMLYIKIACAQKGYPSLDNKL
jgi:hypothetical protein